MTNDDMHDAEHDPHADEFEHQHADESWSGGTPVDDFGGDEESAAAASVSEETDATGEMDHDNPAESVEAPRKRRRLLPAVIVIVGVAAVAGMGYFQFQPTIKNLLNGQHPVQPTAHNTALAPQPAAAPKTAMIPVLTASNSTPPSQGVATPSTAAPILTPTGTTPVVAAPVPPPIIGNSDGTPLQATSNTSPLAPPMAPADVTASGAIPPAPTLKAPPTAMMAPAPAPAPPPLVTSTPLAPPIPAPTAAAAPAASMVAAAPSAEAEARLSALASRVDDLQKTMNKATQQLTAISDKLATQPSVPAAATTSPALEDRLTKIEQKLMQMDHTAPTVAPIASSADSSAVTVPTDTSAAAPIPAPKTKHHHVTAAAHPATSAHRHTTTTAAKSKKSLWVLRSASDDQAWIAKSSTTSDLKPVHVGDDVAGIGKVTAIRETDNGWEIDGTKGSVR